MEDLARTVSIILFFPLIASPITFFLVWKWRKRWLMLLAIPVSIVAGTLGFFLLLSEIGVTARAFGLWGLLFALGTWRMIWLDVRGKNHG